jgi:hypothetical protein
MAIFLWAYVNNERSPHDPAIVQCMQDYLQERGLLDENRDEGQMDSCSLPSTARMTIPRIVHSLPLRAGIFH